MSEIILDLVKCLMEKEETDAKIKYFTPVYMKKKQLCGFCIGSSSKTF